MDLIHRSNFSLFLVFYRILWELALPLIQSLVRLDTWLKKNIQKGFLPARWKVRDRLNPQATWDTPELRQSCLWMHCASLGESKGLWAIAQYLLRQSDSLNLVLTSNTDSGFDFLLQQKWKLCQQDPETWKRIDISIAPLDHPKIVRSFLLVHGVRSFALYESDIWPHAVQVAAMQGIPINLVSARMSKKAFQLYRLFPRARQSIFKKINWVQTQGELDQKRFLELGAHSCSCGFDFKASFYLGLNQEQAESQPASFETRHANPPAPALRPRIVFISLHAQELALFEPELPGLMAQFDLTFIPRHLKDLSRFRKILKPIWKKGGFSLQGSVQPLDKAGHRLVDRLGIVSEILKTSHIAFVGGSLIPVGCHNLWEPLVGGLKIYFGEFLGNQEALAHSLIERKLGEILTDITRVREWKNPGPEIRQACQKFVQEQEMTLDYALQECGDRIIATLPILPCPLISA